MLLHLAHDIQKEILFLPWTFAGRDEIQEKDVRRIAMELDWEKQRKKWNMVQNE